MKYNNNMGVHVIIIRSTLFEYGTWTTSQQYVATVIIISINIHNDKNLLHDEHHSWHADAKIKS